MNKYKNNLRKFSVFYITFCLFLLVNALFSIIPIIIARYPIPVFNDTIELSFVIVENCLKLYPFVEEVSLQSLFLNKYQWMMIGALPLLLSYNHTRGKNVKYFFYFYYPFHLLILWIAASYF